MEQVWYIDMQEIVRTVILYNMVDKKNKSDIKQTSIACTLMQRDYKGINNYGFNGVIVYEQNTRKIESKK